MRAKTVLIVDVLARSAITGPAKSQISLVVQIPNRGRDFNLSSMDAATPAFLVTRCRIVLPASFQMPFGILWAELEQGRRAMHSRGLVCASPLRVTIMIFVTTLVTQANRAVIKA